MADKKHIGFYDNKEQFEKDKNENRLRPPYVAYVREGETFKVFYSNDMVLKETQEYSVADLMERLQKVENEHVCCTEDEMDVILSGKQNEVVVTDIKEILGPDGARRVFVKKKIPYNADTFFYVYDGSILEEPENEGLFLDLTKTV